MKTSFCKIDSTKYLRQLKVMPNIVPWANVLLLLVLVNVWCLHYNDPLAFRIDTPVNDVPPTVKNSDDVEGRWLADVHLDENGKIWLDYHEDEPIDLSELPSELKKEFKYKVSKTKIFLIVNKNVPFGTIQQVLKAVKEAGVKDVRLVAAGYTYVFDYINKKTLSEGPESK
jgi:biopolymer transport protein ExbD